MIIYLFFAFVEVYNQEWIYDNQGRWKITKCWKHSPSLVTVTTITVTMSLEA